MTRDKHAAKRQPKEKPMKRSQMMYGEMLLTLVTATAAVSMLVMIIGAAV